MKLMTDSSKVLRATVDQSYDQENVKCLKESVSFSSHRNYLLRAQISRHLLKTKIGDTKDY